MLADPLARPLPGGDQILRMGVRPPDLLGQGTLALLPHQAVPAEHLGVERRVQGDGRVPAAHGLHQRRIRPAHLVAVEVRVAPQVQLLHEHVAVHGSQEPHAVALRHPLEPLPERRLVVHAPRDHQLLVGSRGDELAHDDVDVVVRFDPARHQVVGAPGHAPSVQFTLREVGQDVAAVREVLGDHAVRLPEVVLHRQRVGHQIVAGQAHGGPFAEPQVPAPPLPPLRPAPLEAVRVDHHDALRQARQPPEGRVDERVVVGHHVVDVEPSPQRVGE